ncbi:MAG: hypothetical protein JWL68_157 [Actinomycetia bacterium]|jgi:hypothetical protein|nr:hypothetical protein [Actinomycetes bacterium]
MAPALSLLSRTAIDPAGKWATSTQSPLAVLALDFLQTTRNYTENPIARS